MRLRRAGVAAVLVLSIAGASWSWSRLEAARSSRPGSAQVLYLPSGDYLRVASLGFPQVLADLIYLWSIQYYGNFDANDRFRYLEHVYSQVITELDPHYIDPYLVGALIMSVEAGDHEMALRLLDKGIAANPDEWILPFDAGFLCYDVLGDLPRAARYLEKAMNLPGAPRAIRRMHAELYNRMGDKRTSLRHWEEVYRDASDAYVRDVAWRHVHDLTIEVDLETLRQAVAAWRQRTGSWPINLETLARAGLIAKVPADPDGGAYLYDRHTGTVSSQTRFALYRKSPP